MQAEQLATGANTAKVLSDIPTGKGNALDELLNGGADILGGMKD